jgi:acetyl-CoA synthetase
MVAVHLAPWAGAVYLFRTRSRANVSAVDPSPLGERLQAMLAHERFPPPPDFAEAALMNDEEVYARAAADPEAFWAEQAGLLTWLAPWRTTLEASHPPFYQWFAGGTLNASYNCLDRHVEAGGGGRAAILWRGEDGDELSLSYSALLEAVGRLAGGLRELGVNKGDVVGIHLPMIPEAAIAMLACARIGAVHNVVFGGFSPPSVRERLEVSRAKALITADGARRRGRTTAVKQALDEFLDGLPALESVVVVRNTGTSCPMRDGRDVFYDDLVSRAAACRPVAVDAQDPLFMLYSSGSTAKPKGIVHATGGYLTGVAYTTQAVFDLRPGWDVFWCTADVGWITGHSYVVYGPLLHGATVVMYEGAPDYPHRGIWWELCERYGVTTFYTAPTAIRACMKWGAEHVAKYDLTRLRLLGSVGEPINPKAWLWYHEVIGGGRCPIVDTWWQTETGHIMIAGLPGLVAGKPGSATRPLPGIAVAVVDKHGADAGTEQGYLVVTRPWPGMLQTLHGEKERFVETYFGRFGPDVYVAGDAARRDVDGDFWIIGRVDDVINVSGHRLSTAEIESAIVSHPDVAEAAVIGEHDDDTGQAIAAFVTLEGDAEGSPETAAEIVALVGERIGKFARPKRILWAHDLPKTRSGKIMRRLLRDIAEGRELGDVTTLGDPAVMAELQRRFQGRDAEERRPV